MSWKPSFSKGKTPNFKICTMHRQYQNFKTCFRNRPKKQAKNHPKLMQIWWKSRLRTTMATEIDHKRFRDRLRERLLGLLTNFVSIWGAIWVQNLPKMCGGDWGNPLPGSIWCHFAAPIIFFSGLASFFFHLGTISTPLWVQFGGPWVDSKEHLFSFSPGKKDFLGVLAERWSMVRQNARSV